MLKIEKKRIFVLKDKNLKGKIVGVKFTKFSEIVKIFKISQIFHSSGEKMNVIKDSFLKSASKRDK